MITEIVTLLTFLFVGAAFMQTIGLTSYAVATFYPLIGMGVYVLVAYCQALGGTFTSPRITTAICMGLVALCAFYKRRETFNARFLLPLMSMSLILIVFVLVFWNANLVKLHIDSLGYLVSGSLLESGKVDLIGAHNAVKRFSSIAILHAPANGQGELYLRALGPVIGLSTLGALFWFISTGLERSLPRKEAITFAIAGCLLLLTNNRFVWHVFYINGHLITAAFMLVAVASGWLAALKPSSSKQLLCLQALAAAGLVWSRPEGALMAALALLPTLLSGRVSWRWRAGILIVFGLAVLLQQGFIAMRTWPRIPSSAEQLLGLGVLAVVLSPLLSLRALEVHGKYLLPAVEASLWIALLAFAIYRPEVLEVSAIATFVNAFLGAGGWGASLAVLGILGLVVLVLPSAPDRVFLRFPLTTFIPLAFLLAYLREGAYRVNAVDSLNRMLIHIVPLAILFVVSAAASSAWAQRLGRGESHRPGARAARTEAP